MKPEHLDSLKNGTSDEIKSILKEFNEKYSNLFDFTEFNVNGQWFHIWNSILDILRNDKKYNEIFPEALSSIRILARDKVNLNSNINLQKDLECLLKIADLGPENIVLNKSEEYHKDVIIESLKCLCNIIYQSAECQILCIKNTSTNGILKRIRNPIKYPYEIELFDMKLLFLITALATQSRPKVRDDLNGLTYLTEWLDLKVKETEVNGRTIEQADLISEILKVLFNITANEDKITNENEILNRRLVSVLRAILCIFGDMKMEKDLVVLGHCINLLTNLPKNALNELIIKEDKCKNEKIFEKYSVKSLEIVLEYFKQTLNGSQLAVEREKQVPVITLLLKMSRCNSIMRHYIRSIILPPLKDVTKRPEIGNEFRNHLCRYLTSVDMTIKNLSAELLFVLCKENVGRMIKHIGYGNAAGLFANKGVLDCRKKENTEYSSDSEDSDTEEYKKLLPNINPVLGCYEPSKRDPLDGMNDEQKEYEAMKLVNLMDELHKKGIVQPCKIGEDGKPKAVDHILELQEELPQQQIEQKNKS